MNFAIIAPLRCEMEVDGQSLQHVLPVPDPDFELSSPRETGNGWTIYRIDPTKGKCHSLPFSD